MTSHAPLEFVFGGALWNTPTPYAEKEQGQKLLDALKKHKIHTLDTAKIYGDSEKIIGELDAVGRGFTIDSKSPGGIMAGEALQPEALYQHAHESLEKTGLRGKGSLDVYYVHVPDPEIKPEVWLPTMDKLHKEGVFKRLGLSNFTAEQVQEVYDVAESQNLVKPKVFQGSYNAVGRVYDTSLFPTLRKLGMSFYAYSPVAGGFLTKTLDDIKAKAGRFQKGNMVGDIYTKMYSDQETMLQGLEKWGQIADKAGIPKGELAYRWITYHSPLSNEHGDKVITGAKDLDQLETTLVWAEKGPLDAESVTQIDEVWDLVKGDAYESTLHAMMGQR